MNASIQRELNVILANEIISRPINWLWKPWLPRGMMSMLDGNPGVGKSMISLDLVARLTTGRPMPNNGETYPPQNCLVVALEDPLDCVVRPRLEAAGADLSRVVFLEGVREKDGHGELETILQLPRDLELIAEAVRKHRPALMVIDPFFAVLGYDKRGRFIKANDDQGVRRLTAQFKVMAERENIAILPLRHLNKHGGGSAITRGSGTIAITGQARSVMLAARDSEMPGAGILAMTKTNVADSPGSLRYRIVGEGLTARIEWVGLADASADEIVTLGRPKDLHERLVLRAMDFLETALELDGRPWEELVEMAAKEGISEITLRRARQKKMLDKEFVGKHKCVWKLPRRLFSSF